MLRHPCRLIYGKCVWHAHPRQEQADADEHEIDWSTIGQTMKTYIAGPETRATSSPNVNYPSVLTIHLAKDIRDVRSLSPESGSLESAGEPSELRQ